MERKCSLCSLGEGKRPVRGEIYSPYPVKSPRVMVVTESPGFEEEKWGRPLLGNAGEEARHHLDLNGISRHGIWIDHLCRCSSPEGKSSPTSCITACTSAHLVPKIQELKPDWVIAMGGSAIQFFTGDSNVEMSHGIPRPCSVDGHSFTLIPTYHPAAGLHSPETMVMFHVDIRTAGDVIRGKIPPYPPVDEFEGSEDYRVITDEDKWSLDDHQHSIVAIDTEWARGNPWCLSFSVAPGWSRVIMNGHQSQLNRLNALVNSPDTITVVHNALYDLPVLDKMGVYPAKPVDTMVMAYLLQSEPQGLKPLAGRHCGMKMKEYSDMVDWKTEEKIKEYLEVAMTLDYPDPPPILEWKKGEPHVRKPQNIKRKISSILKKMDDGESIWERWKAVKEGKEVVEEILGPFVEADLSDINRKDAIYYSARDADATIRVYPILNQKIEALGLTDTLLRDMRAMPMVVDMMNNGMKVNKRSFKKAGDYFQERMDILQRRIQILAGKYFDGQMINPNSYPQMSKLIYDDLRLHEKGGKHKAKKGGKKSTADDILKRYLGLNPIVQDIIDWRAYAKLKDSYTDSIPKKVSPDGRIRTTLRMTRVITGRLSSSNPNLMAQPTRSDEGKKVRDCYEAEDDFLMVSGDYSQVEMRVAASESRDRKMVELFLAEEDIHAHTAAEMFGIPISQVDEMKHRYPAKRVGFGILNLITAEGLHRELTVGGSTIHSVDDCRQMIDAWFKIYSGVALYMKSNGEHAKRYGYVRDMWGRIRYIPGIKSQNRWSRIEAERQAGNAPIQMGAQGIIKEGMGQVVPVYRSFGGMVKPLIQIHDDIVWEIHEAFTGIATPEIKRVMEGAAGDKICIPLEVDFKVGKQWGSMKKFKI